MNHRPAPTGDDTRNEPAGPIGQRSAIGEDGQRPQTLSLLALVVASTALIASSYAPPFVDDVLRGETTFDTAGEERVVRATVSLDPVAVAAAGSAWVATWPDPQLATMPDPFRSHPLHAEVRQVGPDGPMSGDPESPGSLDLAACKARPDEPCSIDLDVRLLWTGPAPATAVWQLSATVDLTDSRAISDGATVEVMAENSEARLPASILAALGVGLLAAILVVRPFAGASGAGRDSRLRERAPLMLAAVSMMGAGLLFFGTGVIRAMAYEQGLGILLAAQAVALVGAHSLRGRDHGVAEKLAIGSILFGSLPVLLLTVAARQAYRPIEVFVVVALVTFAAAAAFIMRGPLAAPPTGEPLTISQRLFIHAWVAFATLAALTGVTIGALGWGWNAWFAELDASHAPLVAVALVVLVGVARWLHGKSRMLTLISAASLVGAIGLIVLSAIVRLDHPWLSPGEIVLGVVTEPVGLLSILTIAFGVVGILGRRLRPSSSQGTA